MKIPPINQTILEGEKSYFNCIMKLPDISFVTWYKDKILLSDLNDLMLRTFIGEYRKKKILKQNKIFT